MENSIVRGAIQGLIDDSKTIDKVCKKLGCNRIGILDEIDNGLAYRSEEIATIDEIKEVIHAVEKAETSISDAHYNSEEAKDQADNSIRECENATQWVEDAKGITSVWEDKIKAIEEANTDTDTDKEVVKKAPAKKLMNTYNQQ